MTASPETGPVVLLYGCAECNWIYSPQTPEETSKTYLLMAQFKFEQHVCSKYAAGSQQNPFTLIAEESDSVSYAGAISLIFCHVSLLPPLRPFRILASALPVPPD